MNIDCTTVETHDLACKTEPDSRAILLCCEKWDKYFLLNFFQYTRTVILNLDKRPASTIHLCDEFYPGIFLTLRRLNGIH